MIYYLRFNQLVSAISFTALFPLFFFYHVFIANGFISPFFGGFFGPAVVALFPFLVISFLYFLVRRDLVAGYWLLPLFFALMSWSIFWIAFHAFTDPNNPAHIDLMETCVFWMATCSTAIFLPIYSDRFMVFIVFLWAGVIFFSVYLVDSSMLMTAGTGEESSTYQGLARSLLITSFFVVSCIRQTQARWMFAAISVASLFLIGARAELYGFIGAYTVFEFTLNRRSRASQVAFGIVLFAAAIVIANNFDYLSVSRQFEVFNLSDSTSWQARQYLQRFAIFQIESSPIFGVYGGHLMLGEGEYAHNALSAWVSLGFPGFILYTTICVVALVASLRALIASPDSRLARMAVMVSFATLLLIIASQPVFWEVPGLAWGFALAASVEHRKRRSLGLVQRDSMPVKPVRSAGEAIRPTQESLKSARDVGAHR